MAAGGWACTRPSAPALRRRWTQWRALPRRQWTVAAAPPAGACTRCWGCRVHGTPRHAGPHPKHTHPPALPPLRPPLAAVRLLPTATRLLTSNSCPPPHPPPLAAPAAVVACTWRSPAPRRRPPPRARPPAPPSPSCCPPCTSCPTCSARRPKPRQGRARAGAGARPRCLSRWRRRRRSGRRCVARGVWRGVWRGVMVVVARCLGWTLAVHCVVCTSVCAEAIGQKRVQGWCCMPCCSMCGWQARA